MVVGGESSSHSNHPLHHTQHQRPPPPYSSRVGRSREAYRHHHQQQQQLSNEHNSKSAVWNPEERRAAAVGNGLRKAGGECGGNNKNDDRDDDFGYYGSASSELGRCRRLQVIPPADDQHCSAADNRQEPSSSTHNPRGRLGAPMQPQQLLPRVSSLHHCHSVVGEAPRNGLIETRDYERMEISDEFRFLEERTLTSPSRRPPFHFHHQPSAAAGTTKAPNDGSGGVLRAAAEEDSYHRAADDLYYTTRFDSNNNDRLNAWQKTYNYSGKRGAGDGCRPSSAYFRYAFVGVAILQMLVAVGLLVISILRFQRNFQSLKLGTTNGAAGPRLLDFVKTEHDARTNHEGTAIVALKLAPSIFLPAIFQFLASVVALFPLYRRPPKYYMLLTMLFSSVSILLWIECVYLAALELNLRNVQLNSFYDSMNYRLLVALCSVLSVDVLLVGSLLVVYAAAQLASHSRTPNSIVDVHINMITFFVSVICGSLASYALGKSMNELTQDDQSGFISTQPSLPSSAASSRIASSTSADGVAGQQLAALYGIGLKEVIVVGYVMFSALFGLATTVVRRKSLRMGAIVTQGISLFAILIYLLNPDRIIATIFNVRQMLLHGVQRPFSGEILLILYIFIAVLTALVVVQLTSTVINVFPFTPVDVYATPITLPHFGNPIAGSATATPRCQPRSVQHSAL